MTHVTMKVGWGFGQIIPQNSCLGHSELRNSEQHCLEKREKEVDGNQEIITNKIEYVENINKNI